VSSAPTNQEQTNDADEQQIKAALEKGLKDWVERMEREKAELDKATEQDSEPGFDFG
jgi:hypothetical protein